MEQPLLLIELEIGEELHKTGEISGYPVFNDSIIEYKGKKYPLAIFRPYGQKYRLIYDIEIKKKLTEVAKLYKLIRSLKIDKVEPLLPQHPSPSEEIIALFLSHNISPNSYQIPSIDTSLDEDKFYLVNLLEDTGTFVKVRTKGIPLDLDGFDESELAKEFIKPRTRYFIKEGDKIREVDAVTYFKEKAGLKSGLKA